MNDITHSVINVRGVSKALSCSLALTFMPLVAGKPQPRPPAVKKLTTDDLLKLSVIENYTDTEDALLETLRGKPDRVLVQLIKMHERRLSQLQADKPRLYELMRMDIPRNGPAYMACKEAIPVYEDAIKNLKATKL